jgi:hypothetical protein
MGRFFAEHFCQPPSSNVRSTTEQSITRKSGPVSDSESQFVERRGHGILLLLTIIRIRV